MKKRLTSLLAAVLILSLTGCASTKEQSVEESLAFPGLRWDMTSQEVIAALDLKEGQYFQEEEAYDAQKDNPNGCCTIGIQDYKVFGAQADISFRFADYGTGKQALQTIYVIYPEDTDMEKVKAAMVKAYGEPTGSDGAHCVSWSSSQTVYDFLSQEFPDWVTQTEAEESGKTVNDPSALTDQWKHMPLTQVQWWDDSTEYLRMMFNQPNVLSFSSYISPYRELAKSH